MSDEKKYGAKKTSKAKVVVYVVLLLATIASFVFNDKLFGEESIFYDTVVKNNRFVNSLYQKIPALIRTVQIITIAWTVNVLLRGIIKICIPRSNRGLTIFKLLGSFIKYLVAIFAILFILSAWGVNTAALVASAGILGLVVGLGAQSLIADILAGLFIVFEGEYQVGDIIVVDGWRGTVEEIGIRSTRIVDAGGNVKIINNSGITSVINQTQELSVAKASISIEYGESIPRVEIVIRDNLEKIQKAIPEIVEGPFYKGVNLLNSSSVDLLFLAKCKEEDIYTVQRAMNRELKILFDENDINIPFPQIVLNQPIKLDTTSKQTVKRAAERFVKEQQEISKDVEEKI